MQKSQHLAPLARNPSFVVFRQFHWKSVGSTLFSWWKCLSKNNKTSFSHYPWRDLETLTAKSQWLILKCIKISNLPQSNWTLICSKCRYSRRTPWQTSEVVVWMIPRFGIGLRICWVPQPPFHLAFFLARTRALMLGRSGIKGKMKLHQIWPPPMRIWPLYVTYKTGDNLSVSELK